MPRPRTLRSRLLLAQALAVGLLAAGVLAVSLWGARRAVQAVSRELVDRVALDVGAQLDDLYGTAAEHLDSLTGLAREGALRPDGDPGDLRRLALPWINARTEVGAFGVFDGEGRGIALRRGTDGWQERVIRPHEPAVDPDGAAPEGAFDPRVESWWPGAPASEGATARWSERAGGGLSAREGLSVSRRFTMPTGEARVVVVELLLDDLLDDLAAMTITPGALVGVLDDDSRLVAWSGRFAPRGGAAAEGLFLRRPSELGMLLFDDARRAREVAGPSAEREAVRFTSAGETWWGRLRRPFPLPGSGEQMVVVLIPGDELFDERERVLWAVLGLTAVALAIALASARTTARRVAEPIEALVVRSERIAGGDLEPEPPVASDIAEVERLAEAQESMRAGLKTLLKVERDLQIARQIQQATWPRDLPALPGIDLATSAHPADETGGDGYDLVPVPGEPPGRTFLFLADATGHGIGPALSVTQLRSMLRMAIRSGHGLEELVAPVNAQLKADLPGNRFITAWFGRLDADGHGLDSISAGQAPLLHYHAAEDRLEVMRADLPPLGMFPQLPPARPGRIELAPGDLWVVLSDGFYEAEDPAGEQLGVERIGEVLRRCRERPAAEILGELRALLERFTRGAPATDDQTAILLRRRD